MSVQCPECATEIQDDFGIITCPKCSAVFSVDTDGRVIQATGDDQTYEQPPIIQESVIADYIESNEEPLHLLDDPEVNSVSEFPPETKAEDEFVDLLAIEQTQEPSQSFQAVGLTQEKPANVFQEIESFANTENKTGPLSYSMTISGIDIKEVSDQVFSALSDPRFGWNQEYLKKKLKSGNLTLGNLNPAQATMVLKTLRGINVQIQWNQEAFNR